MKHRTDNHAEQQAIRDTAMRESWPYDDERANYDVAEIARTAQRQGFQRKAAA